MEWPKAYSAIYKALTSVWKYQPVQHEFRTNPQMPYPDALVRIRHAPIDNGLDETHGFTMVQELADPV